MFATLTAAFAFFLYSNPVQAMSLEDFQAIDSTAAEFFTNYYANSPITYEGLDLYNFAITPCSGSCDYTVVLYNVQNGAYSSGDGISHFNASITEDRVWNGSAWVYGVTYSHDPTTHTFGGNTPITTTYSGTNGRIITFDRPLFSDSNVRFLESCTDDFLYSSTISPDEFLLCGLSDSGCSVIQTAAISCGGHVISETSPTLSCSAVWASVPNFIDDPFGFFTGIFSAALDWFNCEYQQSLNIVGSFFTTLASNITTGFLTALNAFISGVIVPPDDGYFTTQVALVNTTWETQQPGLTAIKTAFSDGIASLSSPDSFTPITLPPIDFGSGTTSTQTLFDPATLPTGAMNNLKTLISAIMYFSVGMFVVKELSTILSA